MYLIVYTGQMLKMFSIYIPTDNEELDLADCIESAIYLIPLLSV